ncbi:hypothetical protein K504DRAFT_456563 [Pleomassaria siparia CBS 279.74]|uniref:Uncharacterized protein n=1 Tax=Pleomassaria siparia CBS 279.74 TaxID=1314801 RepID=A0A6G1KPS4_9PLEO|nr:hypothetical protein K504DRAFT_456563 [Pleomassaria siparia CBS 279.74]
MRRAVMRRAGRIRLHRMYRERPRQRWKAGSGGGRGSYNTIGISAMLSCLVASSFHGRAPRPFPSPRPRPRPLSPPTHLFFYVDPVWNSLDRWCWWWWRTMMRWSAGEVKVIRWILQRRVGVSVSVGVSEYESECESESG